MTIKLTESAAHRILTLIAEESSSSSLMFRVLVSGGGCSGFQYTFSLDEKNDHVFEDKGVKLTVDSVSLPLLEGAEIDYVEELIGASFQIKNPNATSSCGCGNSFSI
ncbi:MAG: iron-sulfur cluster insertion protein ErpA [Alphaproteobacteria bacterium]|nr:iron-sulfur cluster insertion protein ErpA [Alphaproteobacteria bacterium]